jgi:hypothetical protein
VTARQFRWSALVSSPPTQPRSPPEPDPLDDPQPTAPRAEPDPRAADTPGGVPPEAGIPPGADIPPGAGDPPSGRPGRKSREPDPPGLREQIGATRDSAKRLVDAHLELARAEFEEIGDAIKRAAALGGVAIAALIVAGLLATVGTPLFLGEWIFGSIGWGLLHGLLLLVAVAAAAGLAAVGTESTRIGRSFLIAVLIGVVVAIVLGLNLTNRGWSAVGDALVPAVAADSRPLVAALVSLPIVAGVLIGLLSLLRSLGGGDAAGSDRPSVGARLGMGLPAAAYVGWLVGFGYAYSTGASMPDWRIFASAAAGVVVSEVVLVIVGRWRPGFDLLTGLTIGVVLGLVLAFLTAIAFSRRVGAAMGVTIGLLAWPALMAADFAARGIDVDALKDRFIPKQTIDMTKETIEWARARMPLSRKS